MDFPELPEFLDRRKHVAGNAEPAASGGGAGGAGSPPAVKPAPSPAPNAGQWRDVVDAQGRVHRLFFPPPGRVGHVAGLTERDIAILEELENKQAAHDYLQRQADEARWAQLKIKEAEEKRQRDALRAAAERGQQDFVLKYGKTKARPSRAR